MSVFHLKENVSVLCILTDVVTMNEIISVYIMCLKIYFLNRCFFISYILCNINTRVGQYDNMDFAVLYQNLFYPFTVA